MEQISLPGSSTALPETTELSGGSPSSPFCPTGKRYEWCWALIINEHLDVTDIFALIRTNKALKQIVTDSLKLKINSSFIAKYPIKKHPGMYSALGKSVKNLTLASLDQEIVNYLFKIFPNLEELTMTTINILGDYSLDQVPEKIQKLKLLNCQFDEQFLEESFPRMFKNLTWARLSLPTNRLDRKDVLKHLVKSAKDLRYLHVENIKKLALDKYPLETVEHLRIDFVSDLEYPPLYSVQKRCKKLSRLEISFNAEKRVSGNMLVRTFPALELLKLRYSPDDPEINNLKLKLVQHVVPAEKLQPLFDRISAGKFREVDLQIVRYSSEEERKELNPSGVDYTETLDYGANSTPIEEDFIFGKLNDDCLLKIISNLPFGACLNLARSHGHFRRLFRENVFTRDTISVTGELIQLYPIEEMRSAYDCVCRNIVSLSLGKMKGGTALEVLSRCKKLKHLVMEALALVQAQMIDRLPRGLESLEVNFVFIKQTLWAEWCARLNPTLRVLAVCKLFHRPYSSFWEHERIVGLGKLKKIREFRFTGEMLPLKLKKFLSANKDTLEHLQLAITPEGPTRRAEAEAVAKLCTQLNKLKVLNTGGFPIMKCPAIPLPHVTDLTCDEWTLQFKPTVENLKRLRLRPCGDYPDKPDHKLRTDLLSFKNLEYLHYYDREGDLPMLKAMTSLRHLGTSYELISDGPILEFIKGLPQITRLSVKGYYCSSELPDILAAYFEAEQRAFRYNEVVYDGRGGSRIVHQPPPLEEDERMFQDGDFLNFYGSDTDYVYDDDWGLTDSSD